MLLTLIARGRGEVGLVGNSLLKYTDFIFLIVRMVVMDFFFAKKLMFHGLYNCKLKNEMTLKFLNFFREKINTKLARRALVSLVQSFSLRKFSSPG